MKAICADVRHEITADAVLCEQNAMNNDNLQEIILFFGIFVIHLPDKKKNISEKI